MVTFLAIVATLPPESASVCAHQLIGCTVPHGEGFCPNPGNAELSSLPLRGWALPDRPTCLLCRHTIATGLFPGLPDPTPLSNEHTNKAVVLPGWILRRFTTTYDIGNREGVSSTALVTEVFGSLVLRVYPFAVCLSGGFVPTCVRGIGFIATMNL